MEPKTGKRIVSKGAYVKALFAKTGLNGVGLVLMLSASAFLVIVVWGVYVLLTYITFYMYGIFSSVRLEDTDIGFVIVPLLVSCVAAPMVAKMARASLNKAKRIELVVPLTRANTADLPAPESLVRASQEPMQAQEAVLLRAATEGQETPPEQLLRAVNE